MIIGTLRLLVVLTALCTGVGCAPESPEPTSVASEVDLDGYCAEVRALAEIDQAPQDLEASLRQPPPLAPPFRSVQELAPDDVADDWAALADAMEQIDRVVAEHDAVDFKARRHEILVALKGKDAPPPDYDPQQLEDLSRALSALDRTAAERADPIAAAHALEHCGVEL